jgi:ribonuclease HI
MKKILQKPDLSGRLVNWSVELRQFDIEFHPRTSIKGQVLADFLLEFNNTPEREELPKKETWVVFVGGSSANRKSGVEVALTSPDGEKFQYAIKLDFVTTNNEAEYEVVLARLSIAREMRAKNVEIRSDSQVVVSHVQGVAEAQGEKMIQYLNKVRKYQSNFDRTAMTKIPREENVQADALSKMGSGTGPNVQTSAYEVVIQTEPSITPKLYVMETEEKSTSPEWATDVIQYLRDESLPRDKLLSRKVKMHSARYVLIGGVLYRRGYTEPLLKCLTNSEAEYVLREIHEGVCGNHSGSRMLAHKAMRAGYYWPTMNKDSVRLVQQCNKCQRFARVMKNPPEKLNPISSPWPFAKWGVDIVGPMPPGKGGRKFLLVAVDYFTKWAEAEAFATITTANVIKFIWSSIVCRFGIPHAFVTDN